MLFKMYPSSYKICNQIDSASVYQESASPHI